MSKNKMFISFHSLLKKNVEGANVTIDYEIGKSKTEKVEKT